MNIVKLMVIIIYLIIGSALGIIIIPEIANDLGLQNSSFLKNHYVDGIIGSISVSYTHLTLPTKLL